MPSSLASATQHPRKLVSIEAVLLGRGGSEGEHITFFTCLDLYLKSPDSSERQYKSRTWTRRFDPAVILKQLVSIEAVLVGRGMYANMARIRQSGCRIWLSYIINMWLFYMAVVYP